MWIRDRILEADIMWWHNVLGMLQEGITVQTGVVRPEARGVRLPDELMGDAMRFVACHEVGHSLGLRHNMIASWTFPTDSLRSKTCTDRMNTTSCLLYTSRCVEETGCRLSVSSVKWILDRYRVLWKATRKRIDVYKRHFVK